MTETKNLKLKTYETATDGQELVARYIDNTSDNFQKIDEFCKTDTTLSVEGGIADAKTVGDNVSQLKDDLGEIYDNVKFRKNLVKNVVFGKVVYGTVGNKVKYTDNELYGYTKIDVSNLEYITSTISLGTSNWGCFVDEDDIIVSKVPDAMQSNYVYKIPVGAKYLYASDCWSVGVNLVVLNGSESIIGYSVMDYPFNKVVSVNIDKLEISKETIVSAYHELQDVTDNVIFYKNIATPVEKGKFIAGSVGQKILLRDNPIYGYFKSPVDGGKQITSNIDIANKNFGLVTDKEDTIIGKLNDYKDANYTYPVYNLPTNAKYIYGCMGGWGSVTGDVDIVVAYGNDDITTHSISDYPYGSVINVRIPKLKIEKEKKIINVGTGYAFETILETALYVKKNPNYGYKIIVHSGTYDLIEEFKNVYGSNFFDNLASGEYGVPIGFGETWEFSPNAKVIANYTGNNENVLTSFCAFYCHQGGGNYDFELNGLNVECTNVKYCIHDEMVKSELPYLHKYINCQIKISQNNISKFSTSWGATRCIGGGLGKSGNITIDGCYFESNPETSTYYGAVSYHNSGSPNAMSFITLKNCFFNAGQGFTLQGNSATVTTDETKILISNNSFGHRIEPYEINHMKVYEWNNIVRS